MKEEAIKITLNMCSSLAFKKLIDTHPTLIYHQQKISKYYQSKDKNTYWKEILESLQIIAQHTFDVSEVETNTFGDNYSYFSKEWKRILHKDYFPNHEDLIHFFFPTSNTAQAPSHMTTHHQAQFTWKDLGGSQRPFWVNHFSGLHCVIFFVALDSYNLQIQTNEGLKPEFQETLRLFKKLTDAQYFSSTLFVVALNKEKTFTKKIKDCPLDQIPVVSCFLSLTLEKEWRSNLNIFFQN